MRGTPNIEIKNTVEWIQCQKFAVRHSSSLCVIVYTEETTVIERGIGYQICDILNKGNKLDVTCFIISLFNA